MSNEVKVGAFTVCGMVLLALMLLGLSGATIFGPRQYTLYTTFPEVIGLNPAAEVRFAGVPAGKVLNVEAEGMHVLVTMAVNKDIRIPHASKITVSASGFLGEKYVNILPARDTGVYLEPDDRVAGTPEEVLEHYRNSTFEHISILQFIRDGMAEEARRAMELHITRSMANMLRFYPEPDEKKEG